MAKIQHAAFAEFVVTGKGCKHGALVMKGDSVHSYDVEIAKIDRKKKTIRANVARMSRTTAAHQSAVAMGHAIKLAALGWTLVTFEAKREY